MILYGRQLGHRLTELGQGELWAEVRAAAARTGRPLGLTEHALQLVDWNNPQACPVRLQLLPLVSELEPDHPLCRPDPLAEAAGQSVPGLVRRYPDRALMLTTARCPVYCAFCTRSWAVGPGVDEAGRRQRWEVALAALEADRSVVDVTVSGGDVWQLSPADLRWLGARLLRLPGLERLRLATRGLVADPDRLERGALLGTLAALASLARERGVRLAVHLHINHPRELGPASQRAAALLLQAGLILRSQTVLLRGVNDSIPTLLELVRALVRAGIQPYYVYLADMVVGAEHLRTSLALGAELEKQLRGRTAGFDLPGFVCDVQGGGGKRQLHSWEHYARSWGLAVFRSPVVHAERLFLHADPLRELDPEARRDWLIPERRRVRTQAALEACRCSGSWA